LGNQKENQMKQTKHKYT